MYYKILKNGKVIDVIAKPQFLRFLSSGNVLYTSAASANGILGSDNKTLYSFKSVNRRNVITVTAEKISVKEFNRLKRLLNSTDASGALGSSELDIAKRTKLTELSAACKSVILSGVTVLLADGYQHNFKLTTEDQLNLMLIENQLADESTSAFMYHETDGACRLFSREDMVKIISAYRQHVLYHTTYFNAVKQYIKAQQDEAKVNAFKYGMEILAEVADPFVKQILLNGAVSK